MLDRIWLGAISMFCAGWLVVSIWDGSVFGGLLVYGSTAAMLLLAIVFAARGGARLLRGSGAR